MTNTNILDGPPNKVRPQKMIIQVVFIILTLNFRAKNAEMAIPTPRTLPRGTSGHCRRPETVKALADKLDKHRVVVVRGTPSSGKTTLAHLLKSYYNERGGHVVSTLLWKDVKDPVQHLIRRAECSGYHELTYPYFTEYNVVFLLDDAASTYKDLDLWRGLLKT